MSSVEVDSQDVIRLILQFCRENNLNATMAALQSESQVSLNSVENLDAFRQDILKGNWDSVIRSCDGLQLPMPKAIALYEQLVLELLEVQELELARGILRSTPAMLAMKQEHPERYLRLEHQCSRSGGTDSHDLFGGNKDKRREALAQDLIAEVTEVPPSRLVLLIGQALKWQQSQGLLPPGTQFDLFRGVAAARPDAEDLPCSQAAKIIRLGTKTHATCAVFSPDGQFLVSGCADGFIEVWNPDTGKLCKDLKFQAEEQFMMHDDAVLCAAVSRNADMLATASKSGQIKVWKIITGKCLRKFEQAHTLPISSLSFLKDGSSVVTGSHDNLLRVHGLKSGKMLKELRGHKSFVTSSALSPDGSRIISGSSDGTVRVWDAKSADCVNDFRPVSGQVAEVPICRVISASLPHILGVGDTIVVATRAHTILCFSVAGKLEKTYTLPTEGGCIVDVCLSRMSLWLYALTDDGRLHVVNLKTGSVETSIVAHEQEPLGCAMHPHRNTLATWAEDGVIKLWRP